MVNIFDDIQGPVPVLDSVRLDVMARVATAQPQYAPQKKPSFFERFLGAGFVFETPALARAVVLGGVVLAVFGFSFYVGQDMGGETGAPPAVVASFDDRLVYDIADIVIYGDELPSVSVKPVVVEEDVFEDALWDDWFNESI
jgi:hypothetical protein